MLALILVTSVAIVFTLAFVFWLSKLQDPEPLDVVLKPTDLERVIFTGCSGSGKSTAAARLSGLAKSKYINLDSINYHKGNFLGSTPTEFQAILKQSLEDSEQHWENRWSTDGTYFSRGTIPLLWEKSTCIIYLAYPKYYVFFRQLLPRTLRRILSKEELWGIPNLHENWSNLYTRDGILLYFLRNHAAKSEVYENLRKKYQSEGIIKFIKVTHPEQLEQWFQKVETNVLNASS